MANSAPGVSSGSGSVPRSQPVIQEVALHPIKAAQEFIDGFMDRVAAQSAENGRPIRCAGKGCYYCCKEPVYAEYQEVRYIVANYQGDKAKLAARTFDWWHEFSHGGFLDMPHPDQIQDGDKQHLKRYRAAGLWCPLLENGECTAYENRPLACRLHAAVGNPKRCADDELRLTQKFATTDKTAEAMAIALREQSQNAPRALFEMDHVGLWLAHELLGRRERSSNQYDMLITQTDPYGQEQPAKRIG